MVYFEDTELPYDYNMSEEEKEWVNSLVPKERREFLTPKKFYDKIDSYGKWQRIPPPETTVGEGLKVLNQIIMNIL